MTKRDFLAGAKAALRDLFGGEESVELSVGGGGGNCLIVAEELPSWNCFEAQFIFHQAEVSECGTFPEVLMIQLRAAFLDAGVPCIAGVADDG